MTSTSKVAKSQEGEAAVRKHSPTEERADLRRKPSNRQLQQQQEQGQTPSSVLANAHVPSSSRQFTLDQPQNGEPDEEQGPPVSWSVYTSFWGFWILFYWSLSGQDGRSQLYHLDMFTPLNGD